MTRFHAPPPIVAQGTGMTSQRARDRLVERLKAQGISDGRVLEVIGRVPRHLFVDEALASRAYEDTALPIGLGQTISQPYVVALMTAVPGGKAGFMVVSLLAFVVLGSVLEGIPAIVLFGPLLFPVARALGVHEVHYAMVVIFAMGLGLFAPPFGVGFYAACAIGKVPPDQAFRRVWPHLGALFVALLVIAAIPWISIGFL